MSIRLMKFAAALVLASSIPAGAQPSPSVTPSRDDRAKASFDRGNALFKQGQYIEARAEFSAGYELSHRALFLFNIAECSRKNGDDARARDYYTQYLKVEPTGEMAALARQRLVALGRTPDSADKIAALPRPQVDRPAPPRAPVDPPAPRRPSNASTAPPKVPSRNEAPSTVPMPMPVPTALVPGPAVDLDRKSGKMPTKRLVGIGLLGVGAVTMASGIYFWRHSVSLQNEAASACANGCDWAAQSEQYAAGKRAERTEWILVGLGGTALAVGGALYWLGSREQASSQIVIAPSLKGAAVTWSGSW